MKNQQSKNLRSCIVAIWLIIIASSSGCAVQLIAPFDQKVDDGVTNLQKTTAEFFTQIERQGGSKANNYKNHEKFYDDFKVALSGLIVRANAIAKNELTVKQLTILHQQLEKLEQADKKEGISQAAVPQYENAFNRTFTAILTLEVAKKEPKTGGNEK